MPKPQYRQKFRKSWLQDPVLSPCITIVESTNDVVIKCKFCCSVLNSKYSDLKSHATTKKHISNRKVIQGSTQQKISFPKANALDDARLAECKLALFVANHSTILTTVHLVPLCKSIFHGNFKSCALLSLYFNNLYCNILGNESMHLILHKTKCICILKTFWDLIFKKNL